MKQFVAVLLCFAYATADKLPGHGYGYANQRPDNPLELPLPSSNDEVLLLPPAESRQSDTVEEVTMDPLKMLMMVVPGTPGEDYPILDTIPETSFRCEEVATAPFGYYADTDPASGCQVFHVCNDNIKTSFLCHNGSLFNQQAFVCDWWFNVDCQKQKEYYGLNSEIGVIPLPSNAGPGNADSNNGNSNGASDAASGSSNSFSSSPNNGLQEGASQQEPVVAEPEETYLPPQETYLPPPQSYLPPN
ncbi:uncharacterized protein LOC136026485 isoform X2 [Artemia franciscana]|uniref:Chitin-binding type-2 domain-containing protein n=2 Tax=Artemia franciscana TaxID=6661 RepID=A0AA88HQ56_ARTSF|nr:hypothetical protein QYM36_012409 [Artemia franciscana]